MSTALYSRERRLQHKILGLCCDCSNQTEIGFSRCRRCLDREYEARRRLQARYKAAGLCYGCSSKAEIGRHWCRSCMDKQNVLVRKWEIRHNLVGLCLKCSNQVETGHTRCRRCLDRDNESTKKRQLTHVTRGVCRLCKLPSMSKTLCSAHLKKTNSNGRKQRQVWVKGNRCGRCGAPLKDIEETKYCFACMAGRNYPIIKGVLKYETAD